MERVMWRWVWRFFGLAAVLTVLLGVVAGWLAARLGGRPAPWLGVLVAVVAALAAAGLLLPWFQRDMARARAAASGERPGDDRAQG